MNSEAVPVPAATDASFAECPIEGAAETTCQTVKAAATVGLHLTFIDGMRGCAASYIVISHAVQNSLWVPASLPGRILTQVLGYGHAVVTIFITISGFCLMLPVARRGIQLEGGFRRFYKGRIRRILPPYYLTLLLSILVGVLLVPSGQRLEFLRAPGMLFSIMMHLLLVQNLNVATFYSINGPLWSIAVECQIYLFFPLMVWGWKRFGAVRFLGVMFVLAHLVFYLLGHHGATNYFFIFALGMAAAVATVRGSSKAWLMLIGGCGLIGFLVIGERNVTVSDLFVGTLVASLMALLSMGRLSWLRNVLSMRVLVWVGSFSYSLYLIHALLQETYLSTSFSKAHAGTLMQVILLVFVVAPLNYGVAYLFYLFAEKPFLNRRKVIETPTAESLAERATSAAGM